VFVCGHFRGYVFIFIFVGVFLGVGVCSFLFSGGGVWVCVSFPAGFGGMGCLGGFVVVVVGGIGVVVDDEGAGGFMGDGEGVLGHVVFDESVSGFMGGVGCVDDGGKVLG